MTNHEHLAEAPQRSRRRILLATAITALAVAAGVWAFELSGSATKSPTPQATPTTSGSSTEAPSVHDHYPSHNGITATMFWVGEPPDADNHDITNVSSAWVDNWVQEFGGVDNPDSRCGFAPCGFTPKENTFYFALPFNDYNDAGVLKPATVLKQIPWYNGPPPPGQSLVKNRWVAVTFENKTVYGQWEDAGPFGEDDQSYVFGSSAPKAHAGLDLSPAMNDYLHLNGQGQVSWHFVNAPQVPIGPWKTSITTSGLNY